MRRSFIFGIIGSAILLGVYFWLVSAISGWVFAKSQFFDFWYFILGLAIGFGVQIGLYTYLKNAIKTHAESNAGAKGALAVSGTTSTIAMISCCAHYLVNLIPIIGIAGAVSIIAQYQTELFWVGIVANLVGIIYISRRIYILKKEQI